MLNNAYTALHLEPDSEERLLSSLRAGSEGWLIIPKVLHVTLHYLWSTHCNALQDLVLRIQAILLLSDATGSPSPVTFGTPSHFISNETSEDIFYLPTQSSVGLFENLQKQWCSVTTPHLTILKGRKLTNIQIEATLQKLNEIIFPESLSINTQEVFWHWTKAE